MLANLRQGATVGGLGGAVAGLVYGALAIGPAIAARLLRRGAREDVLHAIAAALMLIAVAGLAFARAPWALAVVAFTWGLGTGSNWVMAHTAMQRHASDHEIGRLAAFDELVVGEAQILGQLKEAYARAHATGAVRHDSPTTNSSALMRPPRAARSRSSAPSTPRRSRRR